MNEGFIPNKSPKEKSTTSSLKRLAKIGLIAGGIFGASTINNSVEAQQTIDSVPKKEEVLKINKGEYVLPSDVLFAFKAIVDSTDIVEGAKGVYLSHNFLYGNREERLKSTLAQLGYSHEAIKKYISILKGKNIISSKENALTPDYQKVRAHEWVHKLLKEDVSAKDLKALNEVRDFIMDDYKNKQLAAEAIVLEDYQKASTEEEKQALVNKANDLFQQLQPILSEIDPSGVEIISIVSNPKEFYAYLIGGNLSPKVEETIREKFPEATKILDKLKEKVKEKTKSH